MNSLRKWIYDKLGLSLGDLVNVVILFISICALIIAIKSLNIAVDSLRSAEKSSADQQVVLEASRTALNAAVNNLNTQTQLQQQQYKETLRKPKIKVYFRGHNSKEKVLLHPEVYDHKADNIHQQGSPRITLRGETDGRAYFYLLIDNVGDKDLEQAKISVSCSTPIATKSLGESVRYGSADLSNEGQFIIQFEIKALSPYKELGRGNSYEFSVDTNGPFPKVFSPSKLFACVIHIKAPGTPPFIGGSFFEVSGN